jgi:hypothetical protein
VVTKRANMRLYKIKSSDLRHVAQFTFSHRTLMWLVGAFHTILKLPVALWQFFSNGVCASWNFLDRKRSKKHSLTDLELMCLHDASFKLVESWDR